MFCSICKNEIKPPECYWKSYDCCSACIRKVALEIQNKNKMNQKEIKQEIEEKIKTEIRNGDFVNKMYCPNCSAYLRNHYCDNCSFCGTDQ